MQARWILPIVVIAAAVAFTAGRTSQPPPANPITRLADTSTLEKTLHLTPEQTAKVRTLSAQFNDRAGKACDLHCEARCTLARKLFHENAGPDDVRPYVEKMCMAYAEQEKATVDQLTALRAVLTPEQARLLNRQLAGCICDKCASSDGSCCETHH